MDDYCPRVWHQSATTALQDVGRAQKRFATRRASRDTIEQSPQRSGLHLCRRALRGVLECVQMISTHKTARITVRVTVEALTVPDHVKFHVHRRRQGAPESVVEESQLTLRGKGTGTDHGATISRSTH